VTKNESSARPIGHGILDTALARALATPLRPPSYEIGTQATMRWPAARAELRSIQQFAGLRWSTTKTTREAKSARCRTARDVGCAEHVEEPTAHVA